MKTLFVIVSSLTGFFVGVFTRSLTVSKENAGRIRQLYPVDFYY